MKTLISTALLLTLTGNIQLLSAQNLPIQKAFASSYNYEVGQDYQKAANILIAVYDIKSYELSLRVGWLLYMAGDYTNACIYYRNATELQPTSIEARLGYVMPLSSLEKWDVIEEQYKEILKYDPMHTVANYRLGLIYYYRQDYAKAKPYFEAAMKTYLFDYDILNAAAWNAYMLGDKPVAKDLFNRVLLILPTDEAAIDALKKL